MLYIQEHLRFDFLVPIMKLFTHLGDAGIGWIALWAILATKKATRAKANIMLLALAVTAFVNNIIIKNIAMRARPYDVIEELETLIEPLSSYSFPSGHASSSIACATALTLLFGKRGAISFIPAVIIALSRPFLGVHYVSDIIIGAIVGTLCAVAVVRCRRDNAPNPCRPFN